MMFRPRLPSAFPRTQCIRQRTLPQSTRYPYLQVSFLHADPLLQERRKSIPPPRRISYPILDSQKADIPSVKAFLERIGRDAAKECEDKIKSWKALFRADGRALKAKEIPPRLRRYILMQTEKYRNGEEIVHIRMGRKVGGGERRRNKGPSKTKIGK